MDTVAVRDIVTADIALRSYNRAEEESRSVKEE